MSKKTNQELMRVLQLIVDDLGLAAGIQKRITDTLGGTVDYQREVSSLLDRIIGLIEFLMRTVVVVFFVLAVLTWRVFLWSPSGSLLNKITERWTSLSEGYQILILGFVGAIIAGIIAHIAGQLLMAKIKNILKKHSLQA
jgi:cell division protein FtsX